MRAEQTCKLLAQVKNGVQHLSEKLQHIKMVITSEEACLYVGYYSLHRSHHHIY